MLYWKTNILSFSETPETTTLSKRDRRHRSRKSSRMSSESSLDVDNRVAFNSGSRLTEGGESDDAIGPARSESKTSVDSGNKFYFAGIPFATPLLDQLINNGRLFNFQVTRLPQQRLAPLRLLRISPLTILTIITVSLTSMTTTSRRWSTKSRPSSGTRASTHYQTKLSRETRLSRLQVFLFWWVSIKSLAFFYKYVTQ